MEQFSQEEVGCPPPFQRKKKKKKKTPTSYEKKNPQNYMEEKRKYSTEVWLPSPKKVLSSLTLKAVQTTAPPPRHNCSPQCASALRAYTPG